MKAEEYINKLDAESGTTWTECDEDIAKALNDYAKQQMKEFAEYYLKEIRMRDKIGSMLNPLTTEQLIDEFLNKG